MIRSWIERRRPELQANWERGRLKQPFERRAFVEYGVPSWPDGFDVDAIALYREMETAGLLSEPIGA